MATSSGSLAGVAGGVAAPTFQDAMRLAARYFHRSAPASLAGVTLTITDDCPVSGSATFEAQVANTTYTSNGDYVRVAFDACDSGEGAVVDGSLQVTIVNTQGADFLDDPSAMSPNFPYGVEITYGNFAFIDTANGFWAGIAGDIGFTFTAVTSTTPRRAPVAGPRHLDRDRLSARRDAPRRLAAHRRGRDGRVLRSRRRGVRRRPQLSVASAGRWDFDGRVCSTEMNGCLDVVTNPEFRALADAWYPEAGGSFTISNPVAFIQVTALRSRPAT